MQNRLYFFCRVKTCPYISFGLLSQKNGVIWADLLRLCGIHGIHLGSKETAVHNTHSHSHRHKNESIWGIVTVEAGRCAFYEGAFREFRHLYIRPASNVLFPHSPWHCWGHFLLTWWSCYKLKIKETITASHIKIHASDKADMKSYL